MKKRKKAFGAAILAVAAAFTLSACAVKSNEPDANYPYDVAVQQGYTGSEAEWLSSLETSSTIYRQLYEEAVADGSFSGTYYEFLTSLNLTSDATPYIQRALLSVVSIVCVFQGGMTASSGAGVIISYDESAGDAYILTNYHVLYSSYTGLGSSISVYLYGNETADGEIDATFVGGIKDYDLAVISVTGSSILKESDARAADLGDSDSVIAGEPVYAIGNPLNEDISVSSGIVSVELEWIAMSTNGTSITVPVIRTDAAVNSGNSGGALFNAVGELVGIVNARNASDDVEGIGYAIPSNFALSVARNAIENSGVLAVRDGIDFYVGSSKAVYYETLGRTYIEEKLVVEESSAGLGAKAGVKVGDTLVSGYIVRDGETVVETQFTRSVKFLAFLFEVRRNDTVYLTVSREGTETVLSATLTNAVYFTSYS